jgi:glycogen operon protein
VLAHVKLIAEAWDLGPQGFQVGGFPPGWSEWNGVYRETVRRYWRGDPGQLPDLATRLLGSRDRYEAAGRGPLASVNYVSCHDGFTLRDLVSYAHKHNEANREDNSDGAYDNASANYGVEGPTDDPAVRALRARQQRNLLATLLLSQGVPMLLAGDEIGRTQQGNNNAYCQDNEISWLDWELDRERQALLAFVRALVAFVHRQPLLRRTRFFTGAPVDDRGTPDVRWLAPDGAEMTEAEWHDTERRTLGMRLAGDGSTAPQADGEPRRNDTLLVLLNAAPDVQPFTLPAETGTWELLLDTARVEPFAEPSAPPLHAGGASITLAARSVVVLRGRLTPSGR